MGQQVIFLGTSCQSSKQCIWCQSKADNTWNQANQERQAQIDGFFSVTSASHFVTSVSRFQSGSSMYIQGLIPRNWQRQFRLETKPVRVTFVCLWYTASLCCISLWCFTTKFQMIHKIWSQQETHNWATTWDFQQCGILTSVDWEQSVQPPFKLRNSKCC